MAPPNLLFIFTDEQRYDTLRAYGNSRIHTPNLNRLAEQSCVIERAYVTQTVCTPSRSSIMTGLYPHSNGCTENNVPLSAGVPCLAEMLRGDHETAYFGKWHLGDEIFAQHGFEHWRSIEDGYHKYYSPGRDQNSRSTYHNWLLEHGVKPADGSRFGRGEAARLPERLGKPAYLAGEAERFIRDSANRPFALYVNFLEPHMPFYGPRDDEHDPDTEVYLPENFQHPPTEDQPLKTRLFERKYYHSGHDGMELKTEADWRRIRANYWGLCSLVDTHVGRILRTLEDCGLSENTIVVYTSDHGDMMGSHRLLAKCVQFEEAARVPLMIRLPGQTTGRRIAGPVSQIDLVPTLLELMGEDVPDNLQGRSLKPILTDDSRGEAGNDVFLEWNGPNCGLAADVVGKVELPEELKAYATVEEAADAIRDPVRTVVSRDGWKLNVSPKRGEHELYDLNSDPLELNNLAPQGDQKDRMNDLLGRIRDWQRRTEDTVELPDRL
ncbi:MAG: sulfatase family protein [Phycisphaerae bacterium]